MVPKYGLLVFQQTQPPLGLLRAQVVAQADLVEQLPPDRIYQLALLGGIARRRYGYVAAHRMALGGRVLSCVSLGGVVADQTAAGGAHTRRAAGDSERQRYQ